MPLTELLDVQETARQLSVSRWKVRQLIADGELACVRIGDRVLIRPSDLAAFVESNVERRDPQAAAA